MTKKTLAWLLPLLVLLLVVILALPLIKPAAPREIDLFATPQGTSQYRYAQQYAQLLSEGGIEVQVVETEGVVDTLRRLHQTDRASAGFVESGIEGGLEDPSLTEDLVSLGSLAFEPLWLFVRTDLEIGGLEDLQGRHVYLGPAESAGRAIATVLLKDSGIDSEAFSAEVSGLGPGSVADDLAQGRIDAAFVVGEMRSPVISGLFETEGVEALSNQRAAAFTRLHPDLAELVLPAGTYSLPLNLPVADLHIVSPTLNLVVPDEIHPVVVDLLLEGARSIQREPTLFSVRGTFPNMQYVSLPMSHAATRFYEEGPSRMRQVLPPWAATLADRFALFVLPVLSMAWVLFKSIPAAMGIRFRMKKLGLYRRLEAIEQDFARQPDRERQLKELAEIDRDCASWRVPRMKLDAYFELRQAIHDLRERLSGLE
jgi:TRAP-type uncharacterized transport system substrate-binding protein